MGNCLYKFSVKMRVKCYNLYSQGTFLWCTEYAKPCASTEHMGSITRTFQLRKRRKPWTHKCLQTEWEKLRLEWARAQGCKEPHDSSYYTCPWGRYRTRQEGKWQLSWASVSMISHDSKWFWKALRDRKTKQNSMHTEGRRANCKLSLCHVNQLCGCIRIQAPGGCVEMK